MRVRAALAAAVLLFATACTGGSGPDAVPPPGDSGIEVDTPELRALKAAAGVEDCVPGTAITALPAVTLPCLGGGPDVDLSTLQGPMVINFWASNCGPCRVEMPVLQEFHEAYADQVPVLGVDMLDGYPGKALNQTRQRGATYPQLADPGGDLLTQEVFAKARGLPYLAFVDAAGEVRGQQLGGVTSVEELVTLVEDALDVDLDPAR
ncbi:MAG: TlpA family protein disulfide reductase [Nocardioides sp.]|nr:TlpA family protein disulfide reductase [Nocardioides sp.]